MNYSVLLDIWPLFLVLCFALFPPRVYNVLKYCVDHWAILTSCKGWEFLVDKFFLDVHQMYFSLCNSRIQDPPLTTLIMLIVPGIIATLLVPALCAHLTTQDTERLGTLGF
uniref:Uncharacterized protein n=1 Tax=Myripristis murdjan TaxID=586833 RepID=A0A667Z6N4_9TELE